MKVLVTGSAGFIGGYVVEELLKQGYEVVGIDNLSKYKTYVEKSYDKHPNYKFVNGDATNISLLKTHLEDCEHMLTLASLIGGISYFNAYPSSIMQENEMLMASAFEAALWAHKLKKLKKITAVSSSMIFESTTRWPSREDDIELIPPPKSVYGFQKLAVHYWCNANWLQHNLPYTIIIPWNCIGIGETRAKGEKEIKSGSIALAMSHVLPDLVQKIYKGQYPLRIYGSGEQLRHYTYGSDLARGIASTLDNPNALNESFNLSTPIGHSVKELAFAIWKIINGSQPLEFFNEDPFDNDVLKRIPDISKAKSILNFEASVTLDVALSTIVPWIINQIDLGNI